MFLWARCQKAVTPDQCLFLSTGSGLTSPVSASHLNHQSNGIKLHVTSLTLLGFWEYKLRSLHMGGSFLPTESPLQPLILLDAHRGVTELRDAVRCQITSSLFSLPIGNSNTGWI